MPNYTKPSIVVFRRYREPEFIERVVEVKPEDLQDVKQEPDDENDSAATNYCVKVKQRGSVPFCRIPIRRIPNRRISFCGGLIIGSDRRSVSKQRKIVRFRS